MERTRGDSFNFHKENESKRMKESIHVDRTDSGVMIRTYQVGHVV